MPTNSIRCSRVPELCLLTAFGQLPRKAPPPRTRDNPRNLFPRDFVVILPYGTTNRSGGSFCPRQRTSRKTWKAGKSTDRKGSTWNELVGPPGFEPGTNGL